MQPANASLVYGPLDNDTECMRAALRATDALKHLITHCKADHAQACKAISPARSTQGMICVTLCCDRWYTWCTTSAMLHSVAHQPSLVCPSLPYIYPSCPALSPLSPAPSRCLVRLGTTALFPGNAHTPSGALLAMLPPSAASPGGHTDMK